MAKGPGPRYLVVSSSGYQVTAPLLLLLRLARLVQILERVLSRRFTTVVIEHTTKTFTTVNCLVV